MVEVETSLLNVKDEDMQKTILDVEKAKTNYFHIDVMDGKFVEKNTIEKTKNQMRLINDLTRTPTDVHLMVDDVEDFIYEYLPFEPNIITFHIENLTQEKIMSLINLLKDERVRIGLAIKPQTPFDSVKKYLPYIHQILIMTVEPGKGGQTLLTNMIDKVKEAKKYIDENNLEVDIQVDGGINLATAPKLVKAGANNLVSGNAILAAASYFEIIKDLKNL